MSLHPPSRDRNHHPIPRSSVQPAWKGAGRKDQMAAARQRRHPRLRRTPTVTFLSAATQSRRQDKEQGWTGQGAGSAATQSSSQYKEQGWPGRGGRSPRSRAWRGGPLPVPEGLVPVPAVGQKG